MELIIGFVAGVIAAVVSKPLYTWASGLWAKAADSAE